MTVNSIGDACSAAVAVLPLLLLPTTGTTGWPTIAPALPCVTSGDCT